VRTPAAGHRGGALWVWGPPDRPWAGVHLRGQRDHRQGARQSRREGRGTLAPAAGVPWPDDRCDRRPSWERHDDVGRGRQPHRRVV